MSARAHNDPSDACDVPLAAMLDSLEDVLFREAGELDPVLGRVFAIVRKLRMQLARPVALQDVSEEAMVFLSKARQALRDHSRGGDADGAANPYLGLEQAITSREERDLSEQVSGLNQAAKKLSQRCTAPLGRLAATAQLRDNLDQRTGNFRKAIAFARSLDESQGRLAARLLRALFVDFAATVETWLEQSCAAKEKLQVALNEAEAAFAADLPRGGPGPLEEIEGLDVPDQFTSALFECDRVAEEQVQMHQALLRTLQEDVDQGLAELQPIRRVLDRLEDFSESFGIVAGAGPVITDPSALLDQFREFYTVDGERAAHRAFLDSTLQNDE